MSDLLECWCLMALWHCLGAQSLSVLNGFDRYHLRSVLCSLRQSRAKYSTGIRQFQSQFLAFQVHARLVSVSVFYFMVRKLRLYQTFKLYFA